MTARDGQPEREPTADDLWRWLLTCLNCGEVHDFRPIDNGRRRPWASPVDGHAYASRDYLGSSLRRLRAMWDAEAGETP
jgi:hypothetical protein